MRFWGSVVSWAVVLMAAFSLFSMICIFLLDGIVHGDLYSYGLHFNYNWATPYWTLKNIAFALGWLNIVTAIVVTSYSVVFKQKEVARLMLKAEKARTRALAVLGTKRERATEK